MMAWFPLLCWSQNTEVVKDPTMPLFDVEQGVPFSNKPLEGDKKEAVTLVLQGIVTKSGKKFAVINDQVLSEGQRIEGFQLMVIKDYEVELQGKGEEGELSLTLQKVKIKH